MNEQVFQDLLEEEQQKRREGFRLDQKAIDNINRQVRELMERDEKRNKECND